MSGKVSADDKFGGVVEVEESIPGKWTVAVLLPGNRSAVSLTTHELADWCREVLKRIDPAGEYEECSRCERAQKPAGHSYCSSCMEDLDSVERTCREIRERLEAQAKLT